MYKKHYRNAQSQKRLKKKEFGFHKPQWDCYIKPVLILSITGNPAKITPRSQHAILKEVKKNPRVRVEHLQKSLQPAKTFIRVSMNSVRISVNGKTPQRKTLLSQKQPCVESYICKRCLGSSKDIGDKIKNETLCLEEVKGTSNQLWKTVG